jgi:hypothetical protein
MRKLLIALSAAASIFGAAVASFVLAAPIPLLGPASGCQEASQLLNCLNSQVYGVLGGNGQTRPLSIGSWGTISGATPQTLNTQGGIVTFTGVTVAGVATGAVVINDSLVTASSQCVANLVSDNSAAASFPYIRSVVPTAGVLTVNISNAAAATSTGSSSFGIGFWCNN